MWILVYKIKPRSISVNVCYISFTFICSNAGTKREASNLWKTYFMLNIFPWTTLVHMSNNNFNILDLYYLEEICTMDIISFLLIYFKRLCCIHTCIWSIIIINNKRRKQIPIHNFVYYQPVIYLKHCIILVQQGRLKLSQVSSSCLHLITILFLLWNKFTH